MSVNLQDQIMIMEQKEQELLASGRTDAAHHDDLNAVRNRLSELRHELGQQHERQQEIEKKIEDEEITFSVPGVDFTQLPAELIKLVNLIVKADRRRIYAEETAKYDHLIEKHKDELRAADDRETEYKLQNDKLQEVVRNSKTENEVLARENEDLKNRIGRLLNENTELQSRLSNAAAQIEEKDREISRLNSQIDEYQKAKVFGEREAQKVIDTTTEETNEINSLIVAINHIAGNFHEVVREDGSKMVVHQNDLPSLQVEPVNPFRSETSADFTANTGYVKLPTPQAPEIVTENQFQLPIVDIPTPPIAGLAQGESVRQGEHAETGDASIEARFADIERRISVLEGRVA